MKKKPRKTPIADLFSTRPGVSAQTRVESAVAQLLTELALRDTPVSDADVARMNSELGKDLGPISEKCADTVEKCGGPFGPLREAPRRMRARNVRIRDLEGVVAV